MHNFFKEENAIRQYILNDTKDKNETSMDEIKSLMECFPKSDVTTKRKETEKNPYT